MMSPNTGRRLWNELHYLAIVYYDDTSNQEKWFLVWFKSVEGALGCKTCFRKLERFVKLWPPAYGDDLELWAKCLHDYVNKELGRPFFHPNLTVAKLTEKGIIQ